MGEAIAKLPPREWFGEVKASDLKLVDCAYAGSWQGRRWRDHAIDALLAAGTEPVGR